MMGPQTTHVEAFKHKKSHITKDFQAIKQILHDVGGQDLACVVMELL